MVKSLPPVAKMARDTRKPYARADEIAWLAAALKVGAAPRAEDPERHEADHENLYYSVFDCHYNDVVARAVYAAKRDGGWGASVVVGAALAREAHNALRAANLRKYGCLNCRSRDHAAETCTAAAAA